ncbi:HAMP domain-containing sensor histidine kinase [Seleniivibrio sp.]|uniref:HAMP domain-containing sensor histidine kinase n=1 Tax=Seleniivibrio sp. TaxID=2898801 RepID=UPI0025E04FEA|nr:HAMP domain-containing sensor histidine kinase [Seleniivibrio sp.]MCD8555005.1 HAMP domain-containing histidine kinase [Seleniivibrio sp.]
MRKVYFHSIFFRLLMLTVCLAFFINMIFFGVIHYYSLKADKGLRTKMTDYARYLMNDIGTPPDREKARKLAERLDIAVDYEAGDMRWRVGSLPKDFPEDGFHSVYEDGDILIMFMHGYTEIKKESDIGRVIIRMSPAPEDLDRLRKYGYGVFAAVMFLLICTFLLIRYMLSPIKKMYSAIEEVKKGNYGFKIRHRGNDELAQLCTTFNELTSEIEKAVRSREQLLADIGHELRTPMTSIRIAADMVKDDELRESIIDDVGQMDSLTAKMLESARLNLSDRVVEMDTVDFSALIDRTAAKMNSRGANIVTDVDSQISICANPDMMESLIKNLLGNAVKYSFGDPVSVKAFADDSGLTLTVADKGEGISAKDMPYIFEPFYRSDSARTRNTGYGLGLSLCKKITEIHGGTISVRSEEGRGTEVEVTLPKELINK